MNLKQITSNRAGLRLLPWLTVALFLALGFTLFSSTGRDDAYITFWPAHTLAQYGQILNYNGDHVEQSSSLLYVLILGASCALTTLPAHLLGFVLSILLGCIAVWLTSQLARATGASPSISALLAALMVPLVYWSFAGMETSLVVCLAILLVLATHRYLRDGSILPVLGVITLWLLARPEAPFTFAVFIAASVLFAREHWKRFAVVLCAGLAIAGLICLWRHWQFGSYLPQPALAKSQARPLDGLRYIATNWPLLVLTIPAVLLLKGNLAARLSFGMIAATVVFASAGGDWMEGGRFLAPIVPFTAVGLASIRYRGFAPAMTAACTAWLLVFTFTASSGRPIWNALKPRDGFNYFEYSTPIHAVNIPSILALDTTLGKIASTSNPPLLYSNQMGMVVYHAKLQYGPKFRVLDRQSLVEPTFTRCPLTTHRNRSAGGLAMPYSWAVQAHGPLSGYVERPSIVYDVTPAFEQAVKDNGYSVVWRSQRTSQFIALRESRVFRLTD